MVTAQIVTQQPVEATVVNYSASVLRNRLFGNREVSQDVVNDSSKELVLQHHRMLQEDLSDAMLGMARSLKDRSIAFGEVIRDDSQVCLVCEVDNSWLSMRLICCHGMQRGCDQREEGYRCIVKLHRL
jgi:hypothetical protein